MGKTFSVEPEQLKSAATKISGYADSFEEIYKNLLSQAETMEEAWQGDDNLAYVEKIKTLTTRLEDMTEKLRNASSTLTQQADNYDQRRQDNIIQVGNLSN